MLEMELKDDFNEFGELPESEFEDLMNISSSDLLPSLDLLEKPAYDVHSNQFTS